jgi:hypothetical protein
VGPDLILGAGWAGDIRGAGFRGELTRYFPGKAIQILKRPPSFPYRATIRLPARFTFTPEPYTAATERQESRRDRSFVQPEPVFKIFITGRYALFGQVSYPFTPLLNANLSGIMNPSDGSCYMGPSFSYSLQKNLELMLTGQFFFGSDGTEFGDIGQLYFARLRWSF